MSLFARTRMLHVLPPHLLFLSTVYKESKETSQNRLESNILPNVIFFFTKYAERLQEQSTIVVKLRRRIWLAKNKRIFRLKRLLQATISLLGYLMRYVKATAKTIFLSIQMRTVEARFSIGLRNERYPSTRLTTSLYNVLSLSWFLTSASHLSFRTALASFFRFIIAPSTQQSLVNCRCCLPRKHSDNGPRIRPNDFCHFIIH